MQREIQTNKHWFKDLILACWGVLNFSRRVFLNLMFIVIIIMVFVIIGASAEKPIHINDNSILKLNLTGHIVEQKTFVDPYDEFMSEAVGSRNVEPEVLLTDILFAIKQAKQDPKIHALLLNLQGLYSGGLSKLQEIALAINDFKSSGKSVIAYGDYYSQAQYYLAAHANEVYLHPMGAIGIEGFGRYQTYLKSALEKLKINSHIFRVGTYKSAVEPYMRDSMSSAAKEANQQWLGELWDIYKQDVAGARGIESSNFDTKLESFISKFKEANGNFATFAMDNNWVDDLMNHQQFDRYINEGYNKAKIIDFNTYLAALDQQPYEWSNQRIGIVVAKGTIYDGKRKPGEIGGYSTADLLRQARLDNSIKAVVLRVDSPGGSAFASEIIRNEIEALKQAGKPVVVSMSTLAASGGYWISASADEIWAAPSTITGSIGIFGMFMTFEDSLAELGIYTDGVGTTEMAGLSATRKLSDDMAQIIQMAIEHGYDRFISLVATERGMTYEDVDKIAQGRVWSGITAHKLGLVDQLGYYQQAIDSAAQMAELSDYDVEVISKPLSPMEQVFQDLFSSKALASLMPEPSVDTGLLKVLSALSKDVTQVVKLNDPMGAYVLCLECGQL